MDDIDWSAIPGPRYYDPGAVEDAFRCVTRPGPGDGNPGAAVRGAVGNDHAGTLYPAAVAAAGRLFEIIATMPGQPRTAALCILLDWWGTFHAEPGYEVFTDPAGIRVELVPAIVGAARTARPMIVSVAGEDPGTRKLTSLLLKCIDAGWEVLDY